MATRHKHKVRTPAIDDGAKPYSVYWSIYTDLPGRVAFRKLYWNRLNDAIGRHAHLTGVEREEEWPSQLPSHELRAHVWQHMRTLLFAEAIATMFDAAMRVAPRWRVTSAPQPASKVFDTVFELVWDRVPDQEGLVLPFPALTSIMMQVNAGAGRIIRRGFMAYGDDAPLLGTPLTRTANEQGTLTIDWQLQVQTSTKRQLMETHWPPLLARFGGSAEIIAMDKRSGETGPFSFTVRQTISGITAAEATFATLSNAGSLKVEQIERSEAAMRLRGVQGKASAIMAFDATWQRDSSKAG